MTANNNETWEDYNLLLKTPMEKFMFIYMLVVLLFGNGVGTVLVNQPTLVFGMPILWIWYLAWWIIYVIGTYILNYKMLGIDKNLTIDDSIFDWEYEYKT